MSINIDPANWRLETIGGIKYKLLEGFPRGNIDPENAKIQEKYILQASDLQAFMEESFSSMFLWADNILFWEPTRPMPGQPLLRTVLLDFEPHEGSKPSDPFGSDAGAPSTTYDQFVLVTVNYETSKDRDPDPNDPTTFLEVSANAGGEFLMIQIQGDAKWGGAGGDDVQGPNIPATKIIPETEWTVRWPRVPNSLLPSLIAQMRASMGLVNSSAMPLLHGAVTETVLFMGYSLRETFSWRNTDVESPPVEVEMMFKEKHVVQDGEVLGHNHFHRDDEGEFQKLFLPGGDLMYASTNLNAMFPPILGA